MQIKIILFWVKCGHEREKVKGKKWHWLAILISFGQENIGYSCKGHRSLLPSKDCSKMGFMGACTRAVSTLIPQVLLSWGVMPLLSWESWGKGSKASRGSRAASLLPSPAL